MLLILVVGYTDGYFYLSHLKLFYATQDMNNIIYHDNSPDTVVIYYDQSDLSHI